MDRRQPQNQTCLLYTIATTMGGLGQAYGGSIWEVSGSAASWTIPNSLHASLFRTCTPWHRCTARVTLAYSAYCRGFLSDVSHRLPSTVYCCTFLERAHLKTNVDDNRGPHAATAAANAPSNTLSDGLTLAGDDVHGTNMALSSALYQLISVCGSPLFFAFTYRSPAFTAPSFCPALIPATQLYHAWYRPLLQLLLQQACFSCTYFAIPPISIRFA